MFGLNTKKKLAELDERLTNLAKMVETDHNDLQDLKIQVEAMNVANPELVDRMARLESRQHNLRDGLIELCYDPKPSTPDFVDTPGLDT